MSLFKRNQRLSSPGLAGGSKARMISLSLRKFLALVSAGLFLSLLGASWWIWSFIHSSSLDPGQGGNIASITGQVRIEQDAVGVPTIMADSIEDIFRAQGWVTARDRLFQIDLMRRRSAGRLSEIFGEAVLETDKVHRVLGFSHVANKAYAKMTGNIRRYYEAYAEGVNAFIAEGVLPFEIKVLGYKPAPWTPADSLLVVLSMFEDLEFQNQDHIERAVTLLRKKRSLQVADFLTPIRGFLDNPIVVDKLSSQSLPLKSDLDVSQTSDPIKNVSKLHQLPITGSNAWIVPANKSRSGKPILSGDPHLNLRAPNIWYRVYLKGAGLDVVGVSLPGQPGVVIGTNHQIAWSFTNPYVDALDHVIINEKTPITSRKEQIFVKGGDPVEVIIRETEWGPIYYRHEGVEYALQWRAFDDEALSRLDIVSLNQAKTVEMFLEALSRWNGPAQNIFFAHTDGTIGWSLVGNVLKRIGFDGRAASVRDKNHYWNGYYSFDELPKVVGKDLDYVANGNQRLVPITESGPDPRLFGNNWSSPSRSYRIKELLLQKKKWSSEEMFSILMDTYSHLMVWYRDVLVSALERREDKNKWQQSIYESVRSWDGNVSIENHAYPLLKQFRVQLFSHLLAPLWGVGAYQLENGEEFWPLLKWFNHEPVLRQILSKRPKHLLSAHFESYDEAIIRAAETAAEEIVNRPSQLKHLRWGDRKANIDHPFSVGLPNIVGKYFRMPKIEVAGDHWVPMACSTYHGSFHGPSCRMIVDLGNVKQALFNHAGGQSGHFFSKNYSDQFMPWVHGEAAPLFPGESVASDAIMPKN